MPEFLSRWLRRLDYLIHRSKYEAAMQREMAEHRATMPDPRHFGSSLKLQEVARDVWGWNWLDNLNRDTRLALRSLRRTPGFTLTTITVLSLGLAFVAVTFAVTNAYLIRPLPYAEADRLYHLRYAPPGPWEPNNVSTIDWAALRHVVDAPIVARGETWYIGEPGRGVQSRVLRVNPGFITGLSVRAQLGRALTPEDFADGAAPVAMIGDQLWRSRFGADSTIIGKELPAEREEPGGVSPRPRIVGVLPPGFWFGRESSVLIDVLIPSSEQSRPYLVRLASGVTPAAAEARITATVRNVATDIPNDWTGTHLESMRTRYTEGLKPQLVGPTIAALLVLLIVAANVAVLSLLRVLSRRKELAVRTALGASASNILRLLATETLVLAVVASAIAALATRWALGLLTPMIEAQLGRPAPAGASTLTLDGRVILVVGGAAVLIALILALLPMVLPWQKRLADALRGGGSNGGDAPAMRRARGLLVVAEITGSLVLLACCASLLSRVVTMLSTDLGFNQQQLYRSAIYLPPRSYPESDIPAVQRRIAAALGAPVSYHSWPPFADLPPSPFRLEGNTTEYLAGQMAVNAQYFSLLEIPVQAGRAFTADDRSGAPPVAIISASLARTLWPGSSALGKQIRPGAPNSANLAEAPRTIVGVVADVKQGADDAELRDIYIPFAQGAVGRYAAFYHRSPLPPGQVEQRVREAIAQADPGVVVRWVHDVASDNRQLAGMRFITTMLTSFALFAAALALIGVYGVIAYAARARQREIAIRIAVGASRPSVIALFLKSGGLLLGTGVAAGLFVAVLTGRLLAATFTAVKPFEVRALAAAGGFLLLAGLAAVWWPARRASRIDPVNILKES